MRIPLLAERCAVSESTLRRLFRTAAGQSPQEYLHRLRMHMAAALLQSTQRTVLDIALSVGYPTLSSFQRQFHRVLGVPPTHWRLGARRPRS